MADTVLATNTASKNSTPYKAQFKTSLEYDSDNSIEVNIIRKQACYRLKIIYLFVIGGSGGTSMFSAENGESSAIAQNGSWC